MIRERRLQDSGLQVRLVPFLVIVFFALVFIHASVMEDAYITFRVVDNFVHGEGLRWNLYDRVQAYTHPLWMLLHIPFYALWENIFVITTVLSFLCTMIAVLLPLGTFCRQESVVVCLFLIPLMLSRCFVLYSASGFENALTHALFALFGWTLLHEKQPHYWFWLSFVTALSLLNRLDLAVFYGPIWFYMLMSRFFDVRWRQVIAGFLPLAFWLAFSLFYYGFALPNTYYAKLSGDVPSSQYLYFGWHYLLNFATTDVTSALWIAAMIIAIPFLFSRLLAEGKDRDGQHLFLALGILAYLFYTVHVGGTYLSGRMLSLPFYVSAWLLLSMKEPYRTPGAMYLLGVLLCAIRLSYPATQTLDRWCPECFIGVDLPQHEEMAEEKLLDYVKGKIIPPQPRTLKLPNDAYVADSIGRWGYALDRHIKVIDHMGIADAFMARLPLAGGKLYNTGSMLRAVPPGYFRAVRLGETDKMDKGLAEYYKKLQFVIAGDVWSTERFWEIVRFADGDYDYLLQGYTHPGAKPKTP